MQPSASAVSPWKGIALALLAVVLWSGNFIVARAWHNSISPVSLAFYRWSVATVALLPFAIRFLKKDWPVIRKAWLSLLLTAFTGVTVFNTLIYVAGHYTTAINLALIGTTAAPLFVLFISATVLRQRLHITQVIGALVCVLGILFLLSRGDLHALRNFHFNTGDVLILVAAFSFAVYTVMVRRKPPALSAVSYLFAVFFMGTVLLLPFYLWELPSSQPVAWNGEMVGMLLYLGLGASVAAFLLWNNAIRIIGPARTSLFGNLIPAFSAVEAAVLLGEKLTTAVWVSIALIAAGIVISNYVLFVRRKQAV